MSSESLNLDTNHINIHSNYIFVGSARDIEPQDAVYRGLQGS